MERDAPEQSAVLVLTHRVPYPPDRGDRLRAWRFIQLLAEVVPVDVACFSEEQRLSPERLDPLYQTCRRVAIVRLGTGRWWRAAWRMLQGRTVTEGAFSSRQLTRVLNTWTSRQPYQAVLAYCSSMFQHAEPLVRVASRVLVDLVDVDSRKWQQLAQTGRGWRRWLYRQEAHRLERLERYILKHFPVTVVSNREATILREWEPAAHVHVVRNGVDLEYFRPEETTIQEPCPTAVFVGVLDYEPNIDAVLWFVNRVWPSVRRHVPEARLWLVGKQPAAPIRRLAGRDGIELYSDVPDIRPYVARSHVSIAPLRIARGVQNKVLEAMAMGRAVVATPVALEGIDPPEPPPAVAVESAEAWSENTLRLLTNAAQRERLQIAGREFVERYYNHRECMKPMVSLLLGDGGLDC